MASVSTAAGYGGTAARHMTLVILPAPRRGVRYAAKEVKRILFEGMPHEQRGRAGVRRSAQPDWAWRAAGDAAPRVAIRPLGVRDLQEVARIDAAHTGRRKTGYWRRVLEGLSRKAAAGARVGLAAQARGGLAGYLVGEIRTFEFRSEPCGWVVALGVDRAQLRTGVATALLREAAAAFRRAGARSVRTMVRRNDVPMLTFFRVNGFVAGASVEMEFQLGEPAARGVRARPRPALVVDGAFRQAAPTGRQR